MAPPLSYFHIILVPSLSPDSEGVRAHGAPGQGGQYLCNKAGTRDAPVGFLPLSRFAQPNGRIQMLASSFQISEGSWRAALFAVPRKSDKPGVVFLEKVTCKFFCTSPFWPRTTCGGCTSLAAFPLRKAFWFVAINRRSIPSHSGRLLLLGEFALIVGRPTPGTAELSSSNSLNHKETVASRSLT